MGSVLASLVQSYESFFTSWNLGQIKILNFKNCSLIRPLKNSWHIFICLACLIFYKYLDHLKYAYHTI
ncbi:hypothetical protein BpHYR1_020261 [Brachionus plicatilis]|uniref:Uncharacterized protein n=1 Tax=Brachionus plicatilis TaxID=10195 RepID=A0A3M7QJE5_BRAPC|nr:hypothetical protein BpHYR1_020261 [Brachionus plicatilis]